MWQKYTIEIGCDYIPMAEWGQDHWSTLAYLETCAVDAGGVIENRRMRCHPRLHRGFVGLGFSGLQDGSQYPTRTKNGEVQKHDDWSCLEDMVAAGLVEAEWRVRDSKSEGVFGGLQARVKFTQNGLAIASELRTYKAGGGSFATFTPKLLDISKLVGAR